MKELFSMWKYNTMVALTVLCAGAYMLLLLPFKSIPIIPGITELRPATLLPVIFGLLFGPAGAWGSAIGNLAGDFFGTFSIGSVFGFIGNFIYAYIPYKIWRNIKKRTGEDRSPTINSARKLAQFGMVSIIASISCAILIAWGLDVLEMVPFATLSIIIALNNIVTNLLLGPIILPLIYHPVKKARLLWTDIMHPSDISKASPDRIHIFMLYAGSIGGIVFGLAVSLLFASRLLGGQGISELSAGNLCIGVGMLPFLISLFYGVFNS